MRWYRLVPPGASAASRQRHLPISLGFLDRCQTNDNWPKITRHDISSHGFCCKPVPPCACLAAEGVTLGLRMNYQLIPKELRPVAEKVEAHQRISETDALSLYQTND